MYFFSLIAMFMIVMFLVLLKIIHNIFSDAEYYIIIKMFLIGITINSLVLLFLVMIFKDHKFKEGPKGEVGEIGEKGLRGMPDYCSYCNKPENTLGDEKVRKDKKIIKVEVPVVDYNVKGEPIN